MTYWPLCSSVLWLVVPVPLLGQSAVTAFSDLVAAPCGLVTAPGDLVALESGVRDVCDTPLRWTEGAAV